ncbi:MAG: hypothetical protein IIA90_08650, partial [Chloroflexi bacterium]|nr:hypothetical protein [Chloroflexota bacterium]
MTAGTFTLTFSGQTTAAIAFDATAAAVETALELLSSITDVTGGGGALPGSAVTVDFINPAGDVALMTSDSSGLIGDCTTANVNSDANPTLLTFDSDGDTTADTILVAAGTGVRIVAHVHTGTADAPDGTDVTFSASGSDAVFQEVGLDADADGELDNAGDLSAANNPIVIGQVVRDIDAADGGGGNSGCDSSADTCIDDADAGDADGDPTGTDDGIAIAVIVSSVATQSTVTVSSSVGSDTVDVIWTGVVADVALTRSVDDAVDTTKAVDQTVIAQSGVASADAGVNGDPDLTITARATDAAGNPVSGLDVDCTLDSVGAGRADIGTAQANNDESPDDAIGDPGGDSALSQNTDANGEVQVFVESESEGGNTRGDVTVTCWVDADAGDDLDTTEIRGTTTFRVSGPPANVDLQGNSSMTIGVQTLSAVVTDADGEAVADDSNCTWLLVDPLSIAAFTSGASPSVVATDGDSGKSTNTLVAGAEGSVT